MRILGLFIVATALVTAGCAADHNDTVLPGYYDGYHKPIFPSYYGVQPSGTTGIISNTVSVQSQDMNNDDEF